MNYYFVSCKWETCCDYHNIELFVIAYNRDDALWEIRSFLNKKYPDKKFNISFLYIINVDEKINILFDEKGSK